MREIKFRGKKKDSGEWVKGSYVYAHKWFGTGEAGHFITSIYGDSRVLVSPETVGQHTGLKDKNGVEIYEGDIVAYLDCPASDYYRETEIINKGKIYFSDAQFFVSERETVEMDDLIYDGTFDGEVIGNIYDNPELLEVDE